MALIVWSDAFSVNVCKIDEQHHKLVDFINELHEAMLQGKSKEILSEIIKGLADYTVIHFNTEEALLEKYNYPELALQKEEHALFVKKVKEFQEGFKNEKFGLSIDIMNFLSDWLQNHINGSDKKYSSFLNEHDVF
ncbi:MAG: hemerythrin [Treponema sp. CETP13]|nr:MAG: hemerythrin [Treponema sp. CETP13]